MGTQRIVFTLMQDENDAPYNSIDHDFSDELQADPLISQIHDETTSHETQSSYIDETSAEIDPLERITSKVVDKFFYSEKTTLSQNEDKIFTVLTQLRQLVLDDLKNNPDGNKSKELEDRLYGALDSAMREAYNRNGQTRPDLWLVYAHKDLMVKVNPRPSWRSLINMLNSTEMVLNIAHRFYDQYHQRYSIDSDFESQVRRETHKWLKKYLIKSFVPFLREMGGWDDIHDYHKYHTADSGGGAMAKIAMVGLAAALFYRLSNS